MNSNEMYSNRDLHSYYLAHHGIKGQRWGKRNGPPYPLETQAKFNGKSRNEDIRIKKGSTGYRTEVYDNDTNKPLINTKHAYVSLDILDNMKYTSIAADGEGGVAMDMQGHYNGKTGTRSTKVLFTEDIILPSYNNSIESFINSIRDVGLKEAAEEVAIKENGTRSGHKEHKKQAKQFIKDVKNMKVEECRDRAYVNFMAAMMHDNKLKTAFIKDLKSKGYNAVIDEWDNQFGEGFTKTPIIVFEQDKSFKRVNNLKIDYNDPNIRDYLELYSSGRNIEDIKKRLPKDFKEWYGIK